MLRIDFALSCAPRSPGSARRSRRCPADADDRPPELGATFIHPAHGRLGIPEHSAEARLTHPLYFGGTPITVIDNRNDASWRHHERSPSGPSSVRRTRVTSPAFR